jgi:hypothetical protein
MCDNVVHNIILFEYFICTINYRYSAVYNAKFGCSFRWQCHCRIGYCVQSFGSTQKYRHRSHSVLFTLFLLLSFVYSYRKSPTRFPIVISQQCDNSVVEQVAQSACNDTLFIKVQYFTLFLLWIFIF